MKPREIIQDAAFRALEGDVLPGERIPHAILRIIGDELHLDNLSLENARDLRSDLSETNIDPDERATRVAKSLLGLRGQAYGLMDIITEKPIAEIEKEGKVLTANIVNGVVAYANAYPSNPSKDSTDEFVEAFKIAFNPGGDTNSRLRSAHVATEIITPYLAKRLVAIDWSSNSSVLSAFRQIAADFKLFGSIYRSVAPVVESGFEAEVSQHREFAENLFEIGPLFAKTGQALAGFSGAASNKAQAEFFENVGRALQEGIAQPSDTDLDQMKQRLPRGVECDGVISSASIAHILRVRDETGHNFAVKVKRHNIDQAITDNIRAYGLLVDVSDSFVQSHAGDTAFTANLNVISRALPFALRMLEDDIRKELDTIEEARAQAVAYEKFKLLPEIIIPKVYPEMSDDKHLFMEIEYADRIEDLPANPETLKNLMVFAIQMWRNKVWHADLHPGNIKARKDGTIVVYDWAKPIQLTPKFIRNIISFVRAIASEKPKKVANAYQKIQSNEYKVADAEAIQSTAQDVFMANPGVSVKENKTIQRFIMAMGIRYQSALDFNYASFMRSSAAFSSVIKTELSKPEYGGKMKQGLALSRAIIRASIRVYSKGKNKKISTTKYKE